MRIAFVLLIALLWAASPATGATVVGQTHGGVECDGAGYTVLQSASASGEGYSVPSGGVLTSWSVQGNFDATVVVALRVYRPAEAGWSRVAESAPSPLERYALNTFPARVAVSAGDVVAMRVVAGDTPPCVFETLDPGDVWDEIYPDDGALGDVQTPLWSGEGYRLNLSALVEPDADGDGYGDETQDLCPADAALHDALCPESPSAAPSSPVSTEPPAENPDPAAAPTAPDPVSEPPATPDRLEQTLPRPTGAPVHVRGGRITRSGNVIVRLICPAHACDVHLTVRFHPRVVPPLRSRVRVRAGRVTVRPKLSRAQRRELRRHRHVRLTVSVR